VAQYAAQKAAEGSNRNRDGNAVLAGALASLVTGVALQSVNTVDVRHWSTLPAQIYLARARLAPGKRLLSYATSSGVPQKREVVLKPGYNLIYLRLFPNSAALLTSNDSEMTRTSDPGPKAEPSAPGLGFIKLDSINNFFRGEK
jgi:uncharacterized protein